MTAGARSGPGWERAYMGDPCRRRVKQGLALPATAGLVALAVLAPGPSAAQFKQSHEKRCEDFSLGAETRVLACTWALGAKTLAPARRAGLHFKRGLAHAARRDLDRAIRDYDAALELRPDFALARVNRGNAFDAQGAYGRAIADYDAVLRLKPGAADVYFNRANTYLRMGETAKAIADYDTVIGLKPDDVAARINRGIAYRKAGRLDLAIADFDWALGRDPDSAAAYRHRALAYALKGHFQRAIDEYDRALALDPDSRAAAAGRHRAREALAAERAARDAEAARKKAAAERAAAQRARVKRAAAQQAEAKQAAAERAAAAERQRAQTAARAATDAEVGKCRGEATAPDVRIAACGGLLAAGGHGAEDRAWFQAFLGFGHFKSGDLDAAIASYGEALALNPDHWFAHNGRGNAYHLKRAYDRALLDFAEVIRLRPADPDGYFNRGVTHADSGDHGRALADLGQSIRLAPNNPDAYFFRADSHRRTGEPAAALADMNAALRLRPDVATYYLRRGELHALGGDFGRAVADLRESIERAEAGEPAAQALLAELTPLAADDGPDPAGREAVCWNERANVFARAGACTWLLDHGDLRVIARADVHVQRGSAWQAAGEGALAVRDYDAALALIPTFAAALEKRETARAARPSPR